MRSAFGFPRVFVSRPPTEPGFIYTNDSIYRITVAAADPTKQVAFHRFKNPRKSLKFALRVDEGGVQYRLVTDRTTDELSA